VNATPPRVDRTIRDVRSSDPHAAVANLFSICGAAPLDWILLDFLYENGRVVRRHCSGHARFGRSEYPIGARSPRDLAVPCLQFLDQLETGLIWPDSGWGLGGAEMATMGAGRFEQVDRCVAAKHRYPYIMLDNKLVS
jgi:hypothetical protein